MSTRTLCFLVLFSALFVPKVRAQYFVGAIGSTTWVGVEGGLNLASESFDSLPMNALPNLRTAPLVGVRIEHWFSNNFGLSLGVLYDGKGVEEDYASNASNRDTNNTLYSGSDNFSINYLEIPLLLKYSLGNGTVRPYLFAGPSFGILLSASESASGSLVSVPNFKSYLKSSDVSIYGGLGIMDELEHGPILSFEVGFAAGLGNIYQSVPTRVATDGKLFPQPLDPTTAKSNDFRIALGAEWQI